MKPTVPNRRARPLAAARAQNPEGKSMPMRRCSLPGRSVRLAAAGGGLLCLLALGGPAAARAGLLNPAPLAEGRPPTTGEAPLRSGTLHRPDPLGRPVAPGPREALVAREAAAPGDLAQIGGRRGGPDEPKPVVKEAEGPNRVSPGRAMLYSLLLPGLGQQYAGRPERARLSYVIEGAIWTSFAAFRIQSSHQKDRFIEFAQRFGGVNPAGKDDEYWRLIANYQESEGDAGSANEFVRRQARALYPDDRAAQQAYEQANGYFGDMAWDWQTSDNLARYKQLRSRSIDSRDRGRYSIALALVHRVVSVIDVARIAHLANRPADTGQRDALAPRGQFGLALGGDAEGTVPLLTYHATF